MRPLFLYAHHSWNPHNGHWSCIYPCHICSGQILHKPHRLFPLEGVKRHRPAYRQPHLPCYPANEHIRCGGHRFVIIFRIVLVNKENRGRWSEQGHSLRHLRIGKTGIIARRGTRCERRDAYNERQDSFHNVINRITWDKRFSYNLPNRLEDM